MDGKAIQSVNNILFTESTQGLFLKVQHRGTSSQHEIHVSRQNTSQITYAVPTFTHALCKLPADTKLSQRGAVLLSKCMPEATFITRVQSKSEFMNCSIC